MSKVFKRLGYKIKTTISYRNSRISLHCHIPFTTILQEFFQRYPDIDISVSVLNSHIEQAIETNTFDIGIDREVPYSKKIISEQICEGKIALFYPKTTVKCDELQLFKTIKYYPITTPSIGKI